MYFSPGQISRTDQLENLHMSLIWVSPLLAAISLGGLPTVVFWTFRLRSSFIDFRHIHSCVAVSLMDIVYCAYMGSSAVAAHVR